MQKEKINIVWFRRDLRLKDNTALIKASKSQFPILPLFIFDEDILTHLETNDSRVTFIYETLQKLNESLKESESSFCVKHGKVLEIWKQLTGDFDIQGVYTNEDYEPYAIRRDEEVEALLNRHNIDFKTYKDQVIFAKDEVLKKDGTPYTVFTPYKNQWLKQFQEIEFQENNGQITYVKELFPMPTLADIGFEKGTHEVLPFDLSHIETYQETRDFPSLNSGSNLGPHLRFGTVSIRQIIKEVKDRSEVFLSELIWREFFIQILYHFPESAANNFKKQYDYIQWRNKEDEFERWCNGQTGYPMVDAGMRQLNATGYMHNRVRMVVASFLCKHLLIDWRWGEAYFASKLLDFELSSNVGNWQWAAGTGCDAAPYFRVFNPTAQLQKFDKDFEYVLKWVPEYGTVAYLQPMVDHANARVRAIDTYKRGLAAYK